MNAIANKKLKLFNFGIHDRQYRDKRWKDIPFNATPHGYIAAVTIADAKRVYSEYFKIEPSNGYVRNYWNKGAWGNHMEGITPERGMWIQFSRNETPERVV